MLDGRGFQQWFARAIMAKRAPPDIPATFAVYRNTWLQGLIDALGANYPTVAMILGANLFEAVALGFARKNPARTPVLALYDSGFPEFLARHPLGRDIPYLRDVAALERLWTECFFAPDAVGLDSSGYACLRPEEMLGVNLCLRPATRFVRFETPAVTIWQAHRQGGGFDEIEPEWTAERALITRDGMQVSVTLIDEATRHLLAAIQRGCTIGDAIAESAEARPNDDLVAALATIISSAALAAPRTEDDRAW